MAAIRLLQKNHENIQKNITDIDRSTKNRYIYIYIYIYRPIKI